VVLALIVVVVGLAGASMLGLFRPPPVDVIFGRRPPDPALVAGDPRFKACWIALDRAWLAFPMLRAADFPKHFPGWSEGAPELEVDDPALAVLSRGEMILTTGMGSNDRLDCELCIAVRPPGAAIVHHYGWTRSTPFVRRSTVR
jgi:hypothetical protein